MRRPPVFAVRQNFHTVAAPCIGCFSTDNNSNIGWKISHGMRDRGTRSGTPLAVLSCKLPAIAACSSSLLAEACAAASAALVSSVCIKARTFFSLPWIREQRSQGLHTLFHAPVALSYDVCESDGSTRISSTFQCVRSEADNASQPESAYLESGCCRIGGLGEDIELGGDVGAALCEAGTHLSNSRCHLGRFARRKAAQHRAHLLHQLRLRHSSRSLKPFRASSMPCSSPGRCFQELRHGEGAGRNACKTARRPMHAVSQALPIDVSNEYPKQSALVQDLLGFAWHRCGCVARMS